MKWRTSSLPILIVAWVFFALPFVAVGPNDVEDFYTGVATTKMSIDSMAEGQWPFWNMDSALGVPQPFRFHFITHPLSPLCRIADCAEVLRGAAALQVLAGSFCMMLLVRELTGDALVALLAGITFMFSSSIVQPTYLDDWSTSAIAESTLPILIFAAYRLLKAREPRDELQWALMLGGMAGFILSMSFPFAEIVPTALFLLVQPRVTLGKWRWLSIGLVAGLLMCGAHIYQLAEQYRLTPIDVRRDIHEEPTLVTYLLSAFVAPLRRPGVELSWRTIFFGGPFAIAAIVSMFRMRDAAIRPFMLALVACLALIFIPESWLLNLTTHRWGYRSGINVFGTVLASAALAQFRRDRLRAIVCGLIALQVAVLAFAFWPRWRAVEQAWIDPGLLERSIRVRQDDGITALMASLYRMAPGRVAFAPKAYDATRRFTFARDALVPNELQMAQVPSLYAETHGVTLDPIAPMRFAFIGMSPPTDTTVTTPGTLNVLGVRYVLAMPGDAVEPHLRQIRTASGGLRILENPDAWPEAFFVSALPPTPLPRVPECGNDRFLCVDFEKTHFDREAAPIAMDRHRDGMTLRFAPSNELRYIVVTQWYQPYWRVTAGSARVVRAAEQLVGLVVAPGERAVTIEFLPVVRATLFFMEIAAEVIVFLLVVWLAFARRSDARHAAVAAAEEP